MATTTAWWEGPLISVLVAGRDYVTTPVILWRGKDQTTNLLGLSKLKQIDFCVRARRSCASAYATESVLFFKSTFKFITRINAGVQDSPMGISVRYLSPFLMRTPMAPVCVIAPCSSVDGARISDRLSCSTCTNHGLSSTLAPNSDLFICSQARENHSESAGLSDPPIIITSSVDRPILRLRADGKPARRKERRPRRHK